YGEHAAGRPADRLDERVDHHAGVVMAIPPPHHASPCRRQSAVRSTGPTTLRHPARLRAAIGSATTCVRAAPWRPRSATRAHLPPHAATDAGIFPCHRFTEIGANATMSPRGRKG